MRTMAILNNGETVEVRQIIVNPWTRKREFLLISQEANWVTEDDVKAFWLEEV
jgi:hypothetical protein